MEGFCFWLSDCSLELPEAEVLLSSAPETLLCCAAFRVKSVLLLFHPFSAAWQKI